jgi:hypothetical protein
MRNVCRGNEAYSSFIYSFKFLCGALAVGVPGVSAVIKLRSKMIDRCFSLFQREANVMRFSTATCWDRYWDLHPLYETFMNPPLNSKPCLIKRESIGKSKKYY